MSKLEINYDNSFDQIHDMAKNDDAEVEVLIQESRKFSATFQKQRLEKYDFSKTRSLGIRVIKDGKEGCAYTESLSEHDVLSTYKDAFANAKFLDKPYEPGLFYSEESAQQDQGLFNESLESLDVEIKLKAAAEVEQSALRTDSRVIAVPYNGYSDFSSSIQIYNSKGVQRAYKENGCYAYCYVLAKEGEESAMSLDQQIVRDFSQLNAGYVGQSAAEKTLKKLKGQKPQTGNFPVVLSNKAAQTLIEFISHYFSARAVDKQLSPLKGRLRDKVFSEKFNLVDDPFETRAFGARPFDSEGAPSQKTELVNEGILSSYLTNSVYAKKMNLPHTANASRSPGSELGISESNLVVKAGDQSLESLLGAHPKVIYVDALKGHAGFNAISGDFSMESEGFLYESGNEVEPLTQFVLSGNALRVLREVEALGNDPLISTSSVICPSILITSLTIAGK